MKYKLFAFDGDSLKKESVESPGRPRWVSWRPGDGDGSALIAGDRGALVSYEGGRFKRVQTRTSQNLRCVEFSHAGDTALVSGNGGTLLTATLGSSQPLEGNDARENLRRIGWSRDDKVALVVGNGGAAYALRGRGLEKVHGAETNLRSVAWHPREDYALVCGNCFRDSVGSLTPSPNLFKFEGGASNFIEEHGIQESRADFTGASWKADGSSCFLVGFDQTWHTPTSFTYQGGLTQVPWEGGTVFPTTAAWHPSGKYALIGTCLMRSGEGDCALYRYEAGPSSAVQKVTDLGDFGVSCIAWSPDGAKAFITGSSTVRAFSV